MAVVCDIIRFLIKLIENIINIEDYRFRKLRGKIYNTPEIGPNVLWHLNDVFIECTSFLSIYTLLGDILL